MFKKLTIFVLALLMLSVLSGAAYAENALSEPGLEELIQWKESAIPQQITEDMRDQVITGNLYAEYNGVIAASAGTQLRVFATCDRTIFQVGLPSTVTVHASGASVPYQYSITAYRKPADDNGYYYSFGLTSQTNSLTVTPEGTYQYMIRFTVTAANGDYVTSYSLYSTVTAESFSDPTTVAGKIRKVIADEIKSGMTDRQKALAIHEWITHNSRYDQTYSNHGPEGVLLRGVGTCESYARTFQMFMSELGIPCTFASASGDHAWNHIFVSGGWYIVDVTSDDPLVSGSSAVVSGRERTKFFCVTDAFWAANCTWKTNGLTTPPTGKGPVYPTSEDFAATDISFGENTLHFSETGDLIVRFTAPATGVYLFETRSSLKTNCFVYDENLKPGKINSFWGSMHHYQKLAEGQVLYLAIEQLEYYEPHTETLTVSFASASVGSKEIAIAAGQMVTLSFTAPSDGIYTFESIGYNDTTGYLYSSDWSAITADDNSGTDYNFKITQQLTKNQVVFIMMQYNSSSVSGSEILSISLYNSSAAPSAPSATLTTLTGRRFAALSSNKPTLLFFAKAGCMNCASMLRELQGYDLSALNVVIVEGCGNSLESTKQFYSQYASGITGATMGYGAKNYMWSMIYCVEPNWSGSVYTPVVFYISADKKVVDYTFSYDSSMISRIQTALGVTLQKTTFSGSRLVLPAGTTDIQEQAFLGTGAKLIEIPAGCTSIASNAFDSCSKLRVILNHSNVAITPPSGVVVTDIP